MMDIYVNDLTCGNKENKVAGFVERCFEHKGKRYIKLEVRVQMIDGIVVPLAIQKYVKERWASCVLEQKNKVLLNF